MNKIVLIDLRGRLMLLPSLCDRHVLAAKGAFLV